MGRTMVAAIVALAVAGAAPAALGQTPGDPGEAAATQLQRSVAWRLRAYGYRVDARQLSTRQLAALHMLTHRPGRYIETRMKIRTILSWDRNGAE